MPGGGEPEGDDADRGEVDEERDDGRLVAGDQRGREVGADHAEGRDEPAVAERERHAEEADGGKEGEGDGAAEQAVEGVGHLDAGIEREEAGAGQGRRNEVLDAVQRGVARIGHATRELPDRRGLREVAGGDQGGAEQSAEEHADQRAEPGVLDGVVQEQHDGEGEGAAPEPDHPARREPLLERGRGPGGRRRDECGGGVVRHGDGGFVRFRQRARGDFGRRFGRGGRRRRRAEVADLALERGDAGPEPVLAEECRDPEGDGRQSQERGGTGAEEEPEGHHRAAVSRLCFIVA